MKQAASSKKMTILILSLFSPLVEIFPNLYMSWWTPSNGKLQAYLKAWPRRVLVVLTVWVPILFTLGSITSTPIQLFIAFLVFAAFGLRLYFFDRSLHGLKGDDLDFKEPTKIPEVFYFIAFSSIGWVLYHAVQNNAWLVPVGILTIFFGAGMMATFRKGPRKNFTVDVVGRVVFTGGFLLNLYNLARAAGII